MSYRVNLGELRALVERFEPDPAPAASRSREATADLLRGSPAPLDRHSYSPGHITASGIVLSPDRERVLLVFHRRLARWLQPGGHVEPVDETIVAAARREVLEETGVPLDSGEPPELVGIDVHRIPPARGEPAHLHHDLVFAFLAESEPIPGSSEAQDVVWCAVGKLEAYLPDEALRASIARAVRRSQAPPTRGFTSRPGLPDER